jgi:GTP-binding protein EngB required for normal cell division
MFPTIWHAPRDRFSMAWPPISARPWPTPAGRRVREGYRIVLIGETNAGKSSLFNALVAREAAIVTRSPGPRATCSTPN